MLILSLQEMMATYPSLIRECKLPNGVEPDVLEYAILDSYGALSISQPFTFAERTKMWFRANFDNIEKIVQGYKSQYAIAENYDRTEETVNTSNTESIGKETTIDSEALKETGRGYGKGEVVTTSRIHGNIGVTSSTSLIKEATKFFGGYSMYTVIASMFARDNCVLLYKGVMV